MLAGCSSSSTLLSPRHRLRSESASQFQACHFPSMSTQRLDLPCSFTRKDNTQTRSQPSIRPVGLSLEKPVDAKTNSLKQTVRLPPISVNNRDDFWEKNKSLKKRFAEPFGDEEEDEICMNRAKRKRRNNASSDDFPEEEFVEEKKLSLGHLVGSGSFWLQQPPFDVVVPRSVPPLITGSQVPFSLSCSGEEESSVCFVPRDVICQPSPLSNNPCWVDSVVSQVTNLGGDHKNVESGQGQGKEASVSSTSSGSHGLVLRLSENPSEQLHRTGNGSGRPNPTEGAEVVVPGHIDDDDNQREQEGFELVSLLVGCAEAITSKNIPAINHFIARLGELASPGGSSPMSRLTAYFTEALSLRVARIWPHIFHILPPRELDRVDDDGGTSLRLLNQVSPIPRFIHFTSNEMVLRAFEGKDRVHIIDFDIKQGLQWPSLFQSLASRSNPPTHVRITGIGESKQELIETGDRLAGFAEALNLPFEFHPVVDRLEDVRLWMLHVKEKESVAVNCISVLHKMLYDSTGGALRDFLGLIRSTNPTIVLVAEQEADHNEPVFETRLSNALQYYSAIFDSLDASNAPDSPIRRKIEEMFAREIRNIVACEGVERQDRHQSFRKWRRAMEGGGFRCIKARERELLQSQMLLKMYGTESYKVEKQGEDGCALTLSWLDQALYTISGWELVDVAGSSSSYTQAG
ncbi:OLC1v1029562C1 [Oldenlandia corymbosa var. corymbosa]|uniref:OLC1v1029562C1 n=1 Tax=Oldenlandia corymbosa var. corymbosa TaxID=529605 RepID=A0AAV1CET6_OLDCO|nr:OLC1v1029562C1 [Oldenlandia corymbosa var. corymbosa]